MTEADELPTPHPAFAAHFTDALYEDDADDLAPFGSDEGWDLVTEWGERRDELSAHATVQEVLDESPLPAALEHVGGTGAPGGDGSEGWTPRGTSSRRGSPCCGSAGGSTPRVTRPPCAPSTCWRRTWARGRSSTG